MRAPPPRKGSVVSRGASRLCVCRARAAGPASAATLLRIRRAVRRARRRSRGAAMRGRGAFLDGFRRLAVVRAARAEGLRGEELRQSRDLLEAQQLVAVHADVPHDPAVGHVGFGQLGDDFAHQLQIVRAPRPVVADRRGDAVRELLVDHGDGQQTLFAGVDALRGFEHHVAVVAIDQLVAVVFGIVVADARHRVAVLPDRQLQQLHFGRRHGCWDCSCWPRPFPPARPGFRRPDSGSSACSGSYRSASYFFMIFLRRNTSFLLGVNPMYLQAWSFLRMQMQTRL